MAARPRPQYAAVGALPCAIDLVAFTIGEDGLEVLLVSPPVAEGPWQLPTATWSPSEDLDAAGARFASFVVGTTPAWLEQVGATSEPGHPLGAFLSVGWVTVAPRGTPTAGEAAWFAVAALPEGVPMRHRSLIARGRAHLQQRLDHTTVAFAFLPTQFTLSSLQDVYEALLGRSVHKASFRRALAGAALVAPTDEWRSEGRGRPAQLFTLAPRPRNRRGSARAIRFDFPVD